MPGEKEPLKAGDVVSLAYGADKFVSEQKGQLAKDRMDGAIKAEELERIHGSIQELVEIAKQYEGQVPRELTEVINKVVEQAEEVYRGDPFVRQSTHEAANRQNEFIDNAPQY